MKKFIVCLCIVMLLTLSCFTAFAVDFSPSNINFSQSDVVKYDSPSGFYPIYRRYHSIYNWYNTGSTSNLSYDQLFCNSWFYNSLEAGQVSDSVLADWFVDLFNTLDSDSVSGWDDISDPTAPYLLAYVDPNNRDTVYNLIYMYRTGSHAGTYGYRLVQGSVTGGGKYQHLVSYNPSGDSTACIYQVRIPYNWNGSFSGITVDFITDATKVLFAYQNIIACSSRFVSGQLSSLNITLSRTSTPNLYYYNSFGDIAYVYLDGPTKSFTHAGNLSNVNYIVANVDPTRNGYYYINLIICTYVDVDTNILSSWLLKSQFFRSSVSSVVFREYIVSNGTRIQSNASVPVSLYRYNVKLYFTFPGGTSITPVVITTNSSYNNQFGSIISYDDPYSSIIVIEPSSSSGGVFDGDLETLWYSLEGGFNFIQSVVNRVYLILPPELYAVFVTTFAIIMLLALGRLAIT